MFKSLKLRNFRNFENKDIFFSAEKNFIVGNNGVGKTNILEAISLIYGKNILNKENSNLIKNDENYAFIEIEKDNQKFSISFDKTSNLKKLLINGKKLLKRNLMNYLKKGLFSNLWTGIGCTFLQATEEIL